MKNVIKTLMLAVGLCFWNVQLLLAEEAEWEYHGYFFEWLFLLFCILIIFSLVAIVPIALFGTPKRRKKDMLQRYFRKWLAH